MERFPSMTFLNYFSNKIFLLYRRANCITTWLQQGSYKLTHLFSKYQSCLIGTFNNSNLITSSFLILSFPSGVKIFLQILSLYFHTTHRQQTYYKAGNTFGHKTKHVFVVRYFILIKVHTRWWYNDTIFLFLFLHHHRYR